MAVAEEVAAAVEEVVAAEEQGLDLVPALPEELQGSPVHVATAPQALVLEVAMPDTVDFTAAAAIMAAMAEAGVAGAGATAAGA
jgi:hypothetical protein